MKNILYIIFIISFVLSSCKVKQSITDVLIFDDNQNNIENVNKTNDTIHNDIKVINLDTLSEDSLTVIVDTAILIDTIQYKDVYNVAIILPLQSDTINMNWASHMETDLEDFKIPNKALKSLSFIEGLILAIENQNDKKSRLNIKIYDNKGSLLMTNNILNKLEFEEIDFIIGPISSINLQAVSIYAQENNIVMFSPFSHSKKASNDYRNYMMFKPSIEIHFATIVRFIKDSLTSSHVKILYPNTSKSIEYANTLKFIFDQINDSILDPSMRINYTLVEVEANTNDRRNFKMEDYLDLDISNVVIILPANSGFVHSMLTKLNGQRKDYDITVFGMPNWKKSKTLRLEYFNNLNVHYTDVKWIDRRNPETKDFIRDYKSRYQFYPEDEAFLAYDFYYFFSFLVEEYGLSISDNINFVTHKGIYSDFKFEYSYGFDDSDLGFRPIRHVNNALHVISYNNFRLNKEK